MKILLVYPNLPLMMAPAMSMGIFNAIAKEMNCDVKLFETTQYSDQYSNRHIRMTEIGANRQNKDEEVKDMFLIKDPKNIIPDFVSTVDEYQPDLILASVQEDVWKMTTQLFDAIHDKNIPHVLGGQFPTNAPDIVINHSSINCIARHEGEMVVREIISNIQQGKSFYDTPGLWVKRPNNITIQKNKPQRLCDISDVIPDYDCFQGIRWRRPMGGRMFERAVNYETYRGCPYNCTYCNSPTTRTMSTDISIGDFIRRKTADTIKQEVEHYKKVHDPDLFMIIDDSFLARPAKEIYEFCDVWSEHKTPFWFNTRIENCKPEYLAALKEAGCYRMTFGIESGNEDYRRDVLKRKANNEKYYKYLDHINNSNIPYSLNVIIGMPFETRQHVMDTAEMVHNAKGYDGLTVSMFQPYWGTELRQLAVDNGFLRADFINGWDSGSMGGGYLDSWNLNMPEPYLQEHDVKQLVKTFALYAYYGKGMWDKIHKAETDDVVFKELFDQYQREFFGDLQQGGVDRINKLHSYCAKHDATSTYYFEEIKERK